MLDRTRVEVKRIVEGEVFRLFYDAATKPHQFNGTQRYFEEAVELVVAQALAKAEQTKLRFMGLEREDRVRELISVLDVLGPESLERPAVEAKLANLVLNDAIDS